MDWLAWLLLESTLALAIVLVVINFFLLVHWRRSGRPRALLIGLAMAVILMVVQGAVVTKREHAKRILRGIEQDVLAMQTTNLARALPPDFNVAGYDREGFLNMVRGRYDVVRVLGLRRWAFNVVKDEPDAITVSVQYTSEVRAGGFTGTAISTWRVRFEHRGDDWFIVAVTPVQPFHDWPSVEGFR
ncbi:MAG: hypothetical protein JXO22_03160 [Phycisphaerae bacterium]|nr:hypothetical protein [Phycisphaerae bacterium]